MTQIKMTLVIAYPANTAYKYVVGIDEAVKHMTRLEELCPIGTTRFYLNDTWTPTPPNDKSILLKTVTKKPKGHYFPGMADKKEKPIEEIYWYE